MRRLVATITGLHVLLHGIFGCCDYGWAAPSAGDQTCHCHHVAEAEHADHSPACGVADREAPPQAPHQCVHASCHWLAGAAPSSARLLELQGAGLLVVALPMAMAGPIAAEFWPDAADAKFLALPLRLHLALGVLLI